MQEPQVGTWFPKFRRSQMVADKLREMIFQGALPVGGKLPTEHQLCEEFGVSRTTLREATQMLRSEGLLDVTPGRGSFVRMPDAGDLLEKFAFAMRGNPAASGTHVFDVLQKLLLPLVPAVCRRQEAARHQFLKHLVQPRNNGEDNAELERAWFTLFPSLAQAPLVELVCRLGMAMMAAERARYFQNEESVMRVHHNQLRVSNALVAGDVGMAERLLEQHLSAPVSVVSGRFA